MFEKKIVLHFVSVQVIGSSTLRSFLEILRVHQLSDCSFTLNPFIFLQLHLFVKVVVSEAAIHETSYITRATGRFLYYKRSAESVETLYTLDTEGY